MAIRVTAAEVLKAGVAIQPEEAVAIAQQLIATFRSGRCADVVEPPFGPPTPDRVVLVDDGSVVCRGCDTTPVVSEIAVLLDALLPPSPARVPGGLRYTIARALLDVDVPPFDSLDDLSQTLARYERGPRDQIVIRVLQRLSSSRSVTPMASTERRRPTHATELRRALRDAEVQLYQHQVASRQATSRPVTLEGVIVPPRPSHQRRVAAAAVGVAAGALLTLTGEVIYRSAHDSAMPIPAPPPLIEHASAPSSAPHEPPASQVAVKTAVERRGSSTDARPQTAATPARQAPADQSPTPSSARRPTHPRPRAHPEPSPRRGGKESVLDRLKLRWLRNVFTRPDPERRSG